MVLCFSAKVRTHCTLTFSILPANSPSNGLVRASRNRETITSSLSPPRTYSPEPVRSDNFVQLSSSIRRTSLDDSVDRFTSPMEPPSSHLSRRRTHYLGT